MSKPGCRYVVCDSIENPRKLYVWDLEGNTAFTVGTFVEANWPSPETGRSGLQAHFTPDGEHPCCYVTQHKFCAIAESSWCVTIDQHVVPESVVNTRAG